MKRKRKETERMKKMIVILSVLITISIPEVSFSRKEITKNLYDLDKLEILNIRNKLRESIKNLSVVKEDLKLIYISMSACEAKERFLVMQSRENVENIERIYMYLEAELERVSLIKKDKISYYRYLKEYNIEQMRRLVNEYLNNTQRMYPQISNKAALHLIDKAAETVRSSSELLDKAVEIVERYSKQKEAGVTGH